MRSSQGPGRTGRIEGEVLPEKAVEREPTALVRPACMSGRGVKRGMGPRRGHGSPRATRAAVAPRGCLEIKCARMKLQNGLSQTHGLRLAA